MAKLVEDAIKIYKEANEHLADLEDFGDRFNYIACVIVLFICTIIVSAKQYFFKPISCFIATEVGGSNLLDYVENYCWVQGTVPITYAGRMPSNDEEWRTLEEDKILYYQWVPFVLGLQCILFCMPRLIWKTLYLHTSANGSTLSHVVIRSVEALRAPTTERQAIIEEIADYTEYYFNRRMFPSISTTRRRIKCSPKMNIITSYLVIKILYLINAIGQLILMKHFLGFHSITDVGYGLSVLSDILNGHDWQVTQIFPRVGFCYVELKFLGVSTNAVTAQCALPLNMLNEKIYLLLWWWISAAVVITIFYIILWAFRFSTQNRETNYILKYIRLSTLGYREYDIRDVETFATRYLGREGIFLVRMIRQNAGEQIAAAVVKAFWSRYRSAVVDPLRRGFPGLNGPTSPDSNITPRDIYPQFKNFSKDSSKSGSDVVPSQAYV